MDKTQYTFGSLMHEFVGKHKMLLIAYIIVLITVPIKDIGIPHVIGKLIESLRTQKANYKYIIYIVIMVSIIQVSQSINDYIEVKMFPMFQKFMCRKILDYIFEGSSVNLQELLNGKIMSIMAHAPRTMYNYMDIWRNDVIPQIVVFVFTLIYISSLSYKLGAILLAIIVVYYIIVFGTLSHCKETSRKREECLITVNEEVDDVLMNIVGILNSGQRDNELKKLDRYYDIYKKFGELTMKCTMSYKFVLVPLTLISLVVFITIGYQSAINKELKVESFIVALIIYFYVFNSIIRTIDEIRDTAIRSGMVQEHLKVFQSLAENKMNTSPMTSMYRDKYIYLDKINFNYGNKPILQDFSLEIKKGEKLLILGQIGSGKTTILRLLMRYNSPSSGHLYYNGIPFEKIPREEVRKKIGYIPQNPVLLNRTLFENITYGTVDVTKETVLDLIDKLGLGSIFNESKLHQKVGKHGSKLSGGQRQVVWILRVLTQNPEILLMDEPTSAIDKDTKHFIDNLFAIVMKNRTVIIVSHDEYMSHLCDRTIKMTPSVS